MFSAHLLCMTNLKFLCVPMAHETVCCILSPCPYILPRKARDTQRH